MTTHAHQINVALIHIDGQLADELGAIGVEEDVVLLADRTDGFQILADTDLIVDAHHADQRCVRGDGLVQFVQINEAVVLDGEVGDFVATLFQPTATVQDALVLLGHHMTDRDIRSGL